MNKCPVCIYTLQRLAPFVYMHCNVITPVDVRSRSEYSLRCMNPPPLSSNIAEYFFFFSFTITS